MQRALATLGAGALATALGVGAAGDAEAPFASTGVSDSPEPEAGAAGVAAAGESVLEESEAPALTKAALISILTSMAFYCAFFVMTVRLGSRRVQFHSLQDSNVTQKVEAIIAHQPYRTGDLDLDREGAASELVGWIDDPTPAVSALVSACMPHNSEWPAAFERSKVLAYILRQSKHCSKEEGKLGVAKAGNADFAARGSAVEHSLQGRLLRCLGQQQMRLEKLQKHLERLQMSPAQRQTHRPQTPENCRLRTHLPQTPESCQCCCRPMHLLSCCCCSLQRQNHRTPPRCLLRTHNKAMSQEQLALVPKDESQQLLLLLLLLLSVPLSFT